MDTVSSPAFALAFATVLTAVSLLDLAEFIHQMRQKAIGATKRRAGTKV